MLSAPLFAICDHPGRNRQYVSKWWFSLFSRILFSEPLKLSRNHFEVLKLKIEVSCEVILKKKKTYNILKNVHNAYFRSYLILVPEPTGKVHCHHFFVFWAMIHQVLRFLSWKLHFEKEFFLITSKFKWTRVITLHNWKNHCTEQLYSYIHTKLPRSVAQSYF